MTIYIAGPMSGLPESNRPAFYAAAAKINSIEGFTAVNPAVLPASLPDKAYLPICTAMIEAADGVYMLDGWEKSAGAKAERAYAKRQGKAIVFERFAKTRGEIRARFEGEAARHVEREQLAAMIAERRHERAAHD